MKLSDKLKSFRIDRPSEWMMDEFLRDALQLEKNQIPSGYHIIREDDLYGLLEQNNRLREYISKNYRKGRCDAAIEEGKELLAQSLPEIVDDMKTDKDRMDWLEHQYVSVRKPARYGSFHAFDANVGDEMEWENNPSDIRALIDGQLKRR